MWRLLTTHFTEFSTNQFASLSEVNHCAFSRDGYLLVAGCEDGSIRIWNIGTGKHLLTAKGHKGPVKVCVFSADAKLFASGSKDCTVRVWDTDKGTCLHVLKGHVQSVESMCFSRNSKLLASGSYDNKAILWDPELGELVNIFAKHKKVIKACAFSKDGQYLATGSWDCTVVLWDVQTLQHQQSLRGHSRKVSCVAFSGIGMLASGSWDKTVRVWDPVKGTLIFTLVEHNGPLMSLAFSLDAILLVTAAKDKKVCIWDCEDGTCKKVLKGHLNIVTCCQFSSFETLLIAGTSDDDQIVTRSVENVDLGIFQVCRSETQMEYDSAHDFCLHFHGKGVSNGTSFLDKDNVQLSYFNSNHSLALYLLTYMVFMSDNGSVLKFAETSPPSSFPNIAELQHPRRSPHSANSEILYIPDMIRPSLTAVPSAALSF
ncbi:uncharacterized protein LOC144608246 [Rhinoraja longicauda]